MIITLYKSAIKGNPRFLVMCNFHHMTFSSHSQDSEAKQRNFYNDVIMSL